MHTFTIEFGDTSDDGHGKTADRLVAVLSDHTETELVENFNKNVQKFGFNPTTVAAEYEDNSVPTEFLLPLADAGMALAPELAPKFWWPWFSNYEENTAVADVETLRKLHEQGAKVTLNVDGYLQIVMFLMGHGLEGFLWDCPDRPKSFLDLTSVKNYHLGYGLFW